MGPTNVALVNYFKVDQELRAAKATLDAASKDVRVQERRVHDLLEKQKLAHGRLRESQTKAGSLELDLKSRDAHIEKLRAQQQNAKNNKEYQTFLVEINTGKVDRNKIEDETMKLLEAVERGTKELGELTAALEAERAKAAAMKEQIGSRVAELEAEINAIKPKVEAAGASVPAKTRETFDKMNDRFDGEALAAIEKPDRRREEYVCSACNMELVVDVYNKLHARDELVFCPSCRRILYIPDDLPPEVAVKTRASSKPAADSAHGAKAPPKARKTTGSRREVDELTRVLMKAQGESVRNAVAAGNDPIKCEIRLGGQLLGTFKGQNVENLTRTAKFCLNEAGIGGELLVTEKNSSPAQAEDADASSDGSVAKESAATSAETVSSTAAPMVESPVSEQPVQQPAEQPADQSAEKAANASATIDDHLTADHLTIDDSTTDHSTAETPDSVSK